MAKAQKNTKGAPSWVAKPRRKRPGVHSKKARRVNKSSKGWIKAYKGQGK
jgi:hypothetical protein